MTRYLQLQSDLELDCIPGMVYCPRAGCGARVGSDPSSDVAICQQCSFPFCKLCKQTWHGIESCSTLEKVSYSYRLVCEVSAIALSGGESRGCPE